MHVRQCVYLYGQLNYICHLCRPMTLLHGMNKFLESLDITFRRDPNNFRPRINKLNSVKVGTVHGKRTLLWSGMLQWLDPLVCDLKTAGRMWVQTPPGPLIFSRIDFQVAPSCLWVLVGSQEVNLRVKSWSLIQWICIDLHVQGVRDSSMVSNSKASKHEI